MVREETYRQCGAPASIASVRSCESDLMVDVEVIRPIKAGNGDITGWRPPQRGSSAREEIPRSAVGKLH